MEERVFINSPEEMHTFGIRFAQKVQTGGVIALYGDLGAGKTTFVQGLAKGLGIKKRIISPTFVIIRSYEIPRHSEAEPKNLGDENAPSARSFTNVQDDNKRFYHIDLYRTSGNDKQEYAEIEEIMSNPQNIVAIEWPERMEQWLPNNVWKLTFQQLEETKRKVTIESPMLLDL